MTTLEDIRLIDRVHKIIARCAPMFWHSPQEIIHEINFVTGELYSDSCISARIRDLRKPEFGGHTVNARKRSGSRAWEYQLIKVEQVKAA